MSSATNAHLNALRTLSGNNHPIIVQARLDFFRSISDEHLREVLEICLDQHVSRVAHENAISALLDAAANEAKADSNASSSSAAPAIPVSERTSIKRKRSETDEWRRESVLSFRNNTPAQHHVHSQVFDLGSLDDIEDGLRSVMQAVNETPVPKIDQPTAQFEQPTAQVEPPTAPVSQPARKTEKPIPTIEKLLCIPDKHGKPNFKSLPNFRGAFTTELQAKFDTDFLDTAGHRIEWRRMLENPERSMSKGRCVNNVVFSKSGKPMTYAAADGNESRACDHCVNKDRICAKLIQMGDTVNMAVYPLPPGLREGREWNEMGFWVQN
jgi:hypothetical protein